MNKNDYIISCVWWSMISTLHLVVSIFDYKTGNLSSAFIQIMIFMLISVLVIWNLKLALKS